MTASLSYHECVARLREMRTGIDERNWEVGDLVLVALAEHEGQDPSLPRPTQASIAADADMSPAYVSQCAEAARVIPPYVRASHRWPKDVPWSHCYEVAHWLPRSEAWQDMDDEQRIEAVLSTLYEAGEQGWSVLDLRAALRGQKRPRYAPALSGTYRTLAELNAAYRQWAREEAANPGGGIGFKLDIRRALHNGKISDV